MSTLVPSVLSSAIHKHKPEGIGELLRDYGSTKIENVVLQNAFYCFQKVPEYQQQLGVLEYQIELSRNQLLQTLAGELTDPKRALTAEIETLGVSWPSKLCNPFNPREGDGLSRNSANVGDVGAQNCKPILMEPPAMAEDRVPSSQGEAEPEAPCPRSDVLRRLERETDAFCEQLPALLDRYRGQYVAIYRGKVVCASKDPHQAKRAARKHPDIVAEQTSTGVAPPVLIKMCVPEAGRLRLGATRLSSPLHVVSRGRTGDESH